MAPTMCRRLLCALFVLAAAGTASAQALPGPSGPWWRSDSVKKELSLTNEQSMRIDHIWQGMLPQLQQEKSQLDDLEARLSHLIETDAEEAVVAHQIDRVEALRGNMNKERVLMLMHMRQVLTPEQRTRMNEHVARYRAQQQNQQNQQNQQTQQSQQQQPRTGQGSAARPPQTSSPTRPSQPSTTDPQRRPQ